MVKDTETSIQPKVEDSKLQSVDVYQESLKNEEREAVQRSEDEDQTMFSQISKKIKMYMKEILALKTDKPEEWGSLVEDKKVKVLMLTLSLRKLSRIQKVRVKNNREKTSDHRQCVDAATLQLQNLLYEVAHLKKEVRKCLEFQAADREIDLIPVEQFYQEAPDNISRKDETMDNPHQQRLAQLHWELEQRRGQTQLFDKLTQEKDKVSAIISEQETKLSSLAPRINAILEATLPLQKSLNIPLDETKEHQKVSQWLPDPLYTLWVQVSSYGEACDSSLKCNIEGDAEAARKLATIDEDDSEASDSDGEIDLPEENLARKPRSEKKNRDSEDREDIKLLLSHHPLHLVLKVFSKDENCVIIKFHYAQTLRIVTCFCTLQLKEATINQTPLLTNILDGDSFLDLLFPGDIGTESPNPANTFHLQKLRLQSLTPEHISILGRPYKWAQTLSGLSFLTRETKNSDDDLKSESPVDELEDFDESSLDTPEVNERVPKMVSAPKVTETLSWKMSAEHAHHIIISIKRRLQARLSLNAQLARLESAKCTSDIPVTSEGLVQHFPGKVSSHLRCWKPITFEDYESNISTQFLIKEGIVNSHFLTFKAIFDRQPVSMEAVVAISPDYPNDQPLFSLMLLWGDEAETSATNPHVRQMESEVNVHWCELVPNRNDRFQVLSMQLYRLAMCFDILTEAISTHVTSDQLFHKEKIFFRSARGPDRSLPFKYLPKLGVFAQR